MAKSRSVPKYQPQAINSGQEPHDNGDIPTLSQRRKKIVWWWQYFDCKLLSTFYEMNDPCFSCLETFLQFGSRILRSFPYRPIMEVLILSQKMRRNFNIEYLYSYISETSNEGSWRC